MNDNANNQIYSQLFPTLDQLLPQFGLTLDGDQWRASGGSTPCCNADAKGHLYAYRETGFGVKCQRCGQFTHLTQIVEGGWPTLLAAAGLSPGSTDADRYAHHLIHEPALDFCAAALWADTPESRAVLDYLHGRGLTDGYLKERGYGLVPLQEEWLKVYGTDIADLQSSGYLNSNLTGRIIVPYRDHDGLIRGYWARTLDDREPKYLYAPGMRKDSPYRIDCVDPTNPVLVVEGVLSADILYAQGIDNVIAVGGSRFTNKHAEVCRAVGITQVVLSFDYDPENRAGDKGTETSLHTLAEFKIHAYVVAPTSLSDPKNLNVKEDPDSFILKHSVDAYKQLVRKALEPAAYLLERRLAGLDATQATDMDTAILRTGEVLIATGADAITRGNVVTVLAGWMKQPPDAIEDRLSDAETDVRRRNHHAKLRDGLAKAAGLVDAGDLIALKNHLSDQVMAKLTDVNQEPYGFFDHDSFIKEVSVIPTEIFSTGIEALDNTINALPGELVILAARPRHGKSTLGYNFFINNLLLDNGKTYIFYTHEVPNHLAVARLATIYAYRKYGSSLAMKQDVIAHYRPNMDGSHGFPDSIHAAFDQFGKWGQQHRMVIVNKPSWTALEIRAHAERVRDAGCQIGGVFVDYLEMLPAMDKSASREQQIGQSVHELRLLANEMIIPTIVLCQCNRDQKRTTLESLRYSGQIEQEASTVLGIWNESAERTTDESGLDRITLEIDILKNRGGSQGTLSVEFDKKSGLIATRIGQVITHFNPSHAVASSKIPSAPIGRTVSCNPPSVFGASGSSCSTVQTTDKPVPTDQDSMPLYNEPRVPFSWKKSSSTESNPEQQHE